MLVLALSSAALPPFAVEGAVRRITEYGSVVHLAVRGAVPDELAGLNFASVHPLVDPLSAPRPRRRRGSTAWTAYHLRNARWHLARQLRTPAAPMWWLVRKDDEVLRLARQADVVAALDRYAVYSAYRLRRIAPSRAAVVYGADAAARAVETAT